MTTDRIRLAVLADPHATCEDVGRGWIRRDAPDPDADPLRDIRELIASDELKADVLICPGDLCDKADWNVLQWMWDQLELIATDLGARQIVSTAGNHDIDSRGEHDPLSVEHGLRELAPAFPTRNPAQSASYWNDRVTLVRDDHFQILCLNSSLMRRLAPKEDDHGHVADETLKAIRSLTAEAPSDVNILVCHHHPQPFNRIDPSDRSHMQNGDRLVSLLDDLDGNWLVIHGHKHEPHIDYLEGSAASATRLAAGSVGVNLYPKLSTRVRNQFHIVEISLAEMKQLHLSLAGTVMSWTWHFGTGWKPAERGDGLPHTAGFGFRLDGAALADSLVQWARDQTRLVIERDALRIWEARLPYILPKDMSVLCKRLKDHHRCHVSFTSDGDIDRVVLPDAA